MNPSQTTSTSNPASSQEKFLSRRSLCDRWAVSIDFIRKLEEAGDLNPLRLSSRCLRYRLSEIETIENTK